VFKALGKQLDRHVAAFAKDLAFDLSGKKLTLDSLWVNVLPEGVTGFSKDGRRIYSKEFKRSIAAQCVQSEESIAGIAMRYQINANLVHKWKRQYATQSSLVPVVISQPEEHTMSAPLKSRRREAALTIELPAGIIQADGLVSPALLKAAIHAMIKP